MKLNRTIVLTLTAILIPLCGWAQDLAERLQNLSVTVHATGGQGSGAIITRDGINYVLTAGHVVSEGRRVISFHDNSTGGTKKLSKFDVVTVVKEIVRDGKSIGFTEIQADVVAYSGPEYGDDLALLKLRDHITDDSMEFWNEEEKNTPPVGTKICHVGSFLGQDGSNSYSEGRISQIGRSLFDHSFDQTDVIGFPGSSGGLIATLDGKYIGTLVRRAGQGYILYVPIRRIKTWAHDHNVDFIFDKNGKPSGAIKLETLEPEHDSESIGENSFQLSESLFPYLLFHPASK